MALPYFTIGHSTRSIDEFVDLLRSSGVALVADVRHIPRSRTNPQYNRDALPDALAAFQIGYVHIAGLGGLRSRTQNVDPSSNSFWRNKSFKNYADYTTTDAFRSALEELRALGGCRTTAMMCAEAVWWRCHRRIIADYLIATGETVFHILGPHRVDRAQLTAAARLGPDGTLSYGAQVT